MKGQTAKARVEEQHDAIQEHVVGSNDVVAVNVIPRNGEVWYRLSDGDYAVELAADYQYEAVLGPSGICPSAPYSVNGVPVVYNRATN